MFETIVGYCAAVLLLILSVVLCVLFMAWLLPKWLLSPRYRTDGIKDRGIQKYTFANGRAITYQPAMEMRRYVNSYILSCTNGEKYIKCQLDERIASIKYDVVTYDAYDRIIKVLEICDPVELSGCTSAANLPADTAYVNLIVREVDGCVVSNATVAYYSGVCRVIYALLCVLLCVLETVLLRVAMLYAAEEWFAYSETVSEAGLLFPCVMAALLGALCAGITILFHRSRDIGPCSR